MAIKLEDFIGPPPSPPVAPEVQASDAPESKRGGGIRRRLSAAMTSAVRMLFGSAELNRLTGDWGATPVPADWIINKHQRILVARSREQLFNNDHFKAYARIMRQNVVGPAGLVFQSKARTAAGKTDKKAKSAIERAFADWSKARNCDVAGKLSFRAIQQQCVNSAVTDGEFMLRKFVGRAAGKYGFQLQMLDPVRCPVDYDRNAVNDGDNFIRHGIEYNGYGKPVAYHFLSSSPSRSSDAYIYGGRAYIRIPADEIIHGFRVEIVGQKRGLPWLATGLFRLKQIGAFEDAAIVNARVGAAKLGVIEWPEGTGPDCNDVGEDEGIPEISGEPGEFLSLPNGAKLSKFDPTYPLGEHAAFTKLMLRSISTGGGVPYSDLSGDLEGVNFSSIRQGTLDAREHYKEMQEWLADELAEPVQETWFDNAILRGMIRKDDGTALLAARAEQYADHEFQGRRWDWIDPNADMKAAEGRKNNLLASPGELIRESGRDPEKVWQEIGDDIKAMKAAGIPDDIIQLAMGLKIAPPASNNTPKAEDDGK